MSQNPNAPPSQRRTLTHHQTQGQGGWVGDIPQGALCAVGNTNPRWGAISVGARQTHDCCGGACVFGTANVCVCVCVCVCVSVSVSVSRHVEDGSRYILCGFKCFPGRMYPPRFHPTPQATFEDKGDTPAPQKKGPRRGPKGPKKKKAPNKAEEQLGWDGFDDTAKEQDVCCVGA